MKFDVLKFPKHTKLEAGQMVQVRAYMAFKTVDGSNSIETEIIDTSAHQILAVSKSGEKLFTLREQAYTPSVAPGWRLKEVSIYGEVEQVGNGEMYLTKFNVNI